jgi:hypothetical protein
VLSEECGALLSGFFKELRAEQGDRKDSGG